jgi:hypothetical protein
MKPANSIKRIYRNFSLSALSLCLFGCAVQPQNPQPPEDLMTPPRDTSVKRLRQILSQDLTSETLF